MTTSATEKTRPQGKAGVAPLVPTMEIGPFAEFNARNLETAMRASSAMMKGAGAYWSRVGAFVGKRLQSDVLAARAFSACRSGEDAARTQHEFVSQMIADYFNETHVLLSIGADLAKGVADPIEERAEEAFHNMEARNAARQAAAE